MLNEEQIIETVQKHLEVDGYKLTSKSSADEQGIDLVMTHPQKGIIEIEAKGSTSSKKGTTRFGKAFSRNQVKTHMGVAILKTFQMVNDPKNKDKEIALALPADQGHRDFIKKIRTPLSKSGVSLYFVKPDLKVIKEF